MRPLLLASLLVSAPALARGPFDQGSMRVSIGSSLGATGGAQYFVLGGGFGYYVLDGLELDLELEHWFGARPTITRVSPQVRYALAALEALPPYAGAFYSHWFVGGGEPDVDTAGVRGGVYVLAGEGAFIGLGGAYEWVLSSCSKDCELAYPELFLALSL